MNSFYKVTDYLKKYLQSDPNVKTVKFSSQDHSDLNDKNMYPLVYINPISSPRTNDRSTVSFSFEIAALDQRDQSNEYLTDKFSGNDNLIDNLNITHAILNALSLYLYDNDYDPLIELDRVSDMSPIFSQQVNLLDGWFFTITLKIANIQC